MIELDCQIDVKDPKYAKYVESQIAFRNLRMFICEDEDDLESFARILRDEKQLKINVGMMPDKPADSFVPRFTIDHYKCVKLFALRLNASLSCCLPHPLSYALLFWPSYRM